MNARGNRHSDCTPSGHSLDDQLLGANNRIGAVDVARGTPSFVVGTGGVGFYTFSSTSGPVAPNLLFKNDNTYGALKLVLKANSYSFAFMSNAGAVLDQGTGNCH